MARTLAIIIAGLIVVVAVGVTATARKTDSIYFDGTRDAPVQAAGVETGAV